jgi:hypothetical protein
MKRTSIVIMVICLAGVCAVAKADMTTTGLKLWLKADSITGLNSGDLINTWTDQSVNGLDVQSHVGSAPTYVTNVIGGKPSVRFSDGDYLFRDGVLGSAITGATEATLFWAANPNTSDGRDSILGWGDGGNRLVLHTPYNSNYYFQHGGSFGGGGWPDSFWPAGFHVTGYKLSGGIMTGTVDDVTVLPGIAALDSADVSLTAPLYIGMDQFSNMFRGDICEILIYDRALSPTEYQGVRDYLDAKYLGAQVVPLPGAVLLGAIGLSVAGWRLKRETV